MKKDKYINDIAEIKHLMNKSSRFLSLSGISGVLAGSYAIVASYLGYRQVPALLSWNYIHETSISKNDINILVTIGITTLILAIATGSILTIRQAQKNNESIWDSKSKQLLTNLAIPLITGGLFSLTLIYNGLFGLIAPVTLIFYGLSLINASRYTHEHIKYLGYTEISLGLLASTNIGNGLIFWTVGFGVLHIVYGIFMYSKQK
jgi:hypothetical protein